MRIFIAFLMIFVISAPALAQSKKEMVAKDVELEQRVDSLEQRYLTGDPAAERLMQRMDSLEASQRALTGEIEQLRYERDALRDDVKTLAADMAVMQAVASEMRAHLDMTSAAPQATAPQIYGSEPSYQAQTFPEASQPLQNAAPLVGLGSSTVDMSELLDIGQQKLMSGDFTGAQLAYQQYIEVSPNAADVDQAYFWLAETYFVKSGFSEAADAYLASMRAAPEGDKAPYAMIGLAASFRNLGNTDSACQTLAGFDVQFTSAPSDVRQKADIERQRAGCTS